MALFTIGGILAALGTALSGTVAIGSILGNILTLPFKMFEGHRTTIVFFYWCVLYVDSYIVSAITESFFSIFGVEGIKLSFSSFPLAIINLFTVNLFGWTLIPIHVFIVISFLLLLDLMKMAFTLTK